MKSVGIVRKLDSLGRIVIPIELRKNMKFTSGEGIEIFLEGKNVILRLYDPTCIFCGSMEEVFFFHGKRVCVQCAEEISGGG